MDKGSRNLALGIVVGLAAGVLAGVLLSNRKVKKVDKLRSKISNLAADAQERINNLREMANQHQEKTETN